MLAPKPKEATIQNDGKPLACLLSAARKRRGGRETISPWAPTTCWQSPRQGRQFCLGFHGEIILRSSDSMMRVSLGPCPQSVEGGSLISDVCHEQSGGIYVKWDSVLGI